MKVRTIFVALLIAVVVALIGCGGGGGGTGGTGSGGGAQFFLSDDLSTVYSQVWVTVKKVTVEDSNHNVVSAYDNSSGMVMDLAALNGKFALVSQVNLPAAQYTKAHVTLDKSVTLAPIGGGASQQVTFGELNQAGDKVIDITLSGADISNSNVVLDFDLKEWTVVNGVLTGAGKEGDKHGPEDGAKCVRRNYVGVISNLAGTAPNETFTLTPANGAALTISTSSATAIFNNDGSPNPSLTDAQTNGTHATVFGAWDNATQSLNAAAITINIVADTNKQRVHGAPSNVNATAHTFDVALEGCDNFLPVQANVHVAVGTSTLLFGSAGRVYGIDDFFTQLPSAVEVWVIGTFDSASNTVTALSCRLDDASDHEESVVRGTVVSGSVNAGALTFQVNAAKWDGMWLPPVDHVVAVQMDASAVYWDNEETAIDAATFYSDLPTTTNVRVLGTWDGASKTLHGYKAQLVDVNAGRWIVMDGTPGSGDANAQTFTLTLTRWMDGDFVSGQQVPVSTNGQTVFLVTNPDLSVTSVLKDVFYADIAAGTYKMHVEGPLQQDGSVVARTARLTPISG